MNPLGSVMEEATQDTASHGQTQGKKMFKFYGVCLNFDRYVNEQQLNRWVMDPARGS